jgi:urate oxidase/2-oxo-4-hydroxy-4-carboxy-5-ureidoimidazoline decarboxylase
MPTPAWSMTEINALDRDAFVARLGFLFEGSPWIVEKTWASRPWGSVAALHAAFLAVLADADVDRQVALLRAHPDLVGQAAVAGTLSKESTAEQRAAGLDPGALSAAEIDRFQSLNRDYQATFGFPFVICAREKSKASILAALADRLHNDRDQELRTALSEVSKIALLRLTDVVADNPRSGAEAAASDHFLYRVSYGKHGVAVYRVLATPLRDVAPIPESAFTGRDNNLFACEIDVEVFGDDFLPAYTHGDNSMVVATDSMKNFIIRESLAFPGSTLEGLIHFLGTGFAATYPQLHTLTLTGRQIPFAPATIPDGHGGFRPGGNLFNHERGERAHASLSVARTAGNMAITHHDCGISGIELMKLTGSAFTSFVRDNYTTLPERGDRPLFIHLDVFWRYASVDDMLDLRRRRYVPPEQMRDLLAVTFDDFVSESIQHLIHEMGKRVLARFPQLSEIGFVAQNRTRDPYGQRDDDPRIRVYSDPFPAYGRLTLVMSRAE